MSPSPDRSPSRPAAALSCGCRSAQRMAMSRLYIRLPRATGHVGYLAVGRGAWCRDGGGTPEGSSWSGRTAMRLTRRQRRDLAALGKQLARDDPDLAAQLSRPAGSTFRTRPAGTRVGVLVGRVLLVFGLVMVTYGVVLSVQAATMIGAVALLLCWIPWQHGSGLTPR